MDIANLKLADFTRPEILNDPYPIYRRLRQEDSVHLDPETGGWIVTRHTEASTVLSEKRFSAERLATGRGASGRGTVQEALSRQMLFLDPPDHTRLRGLFTKAFTPHRMEQLRPHIVELVHQLLDRAVGPSGGEADFIRALAGPLPVIVIAQMLGVPSSDWQQVRLWSGSFGRLISGRELSASEAQESQKGILAFIAYFQGLIRKRTEAPQNDMVSDLLAVEDLGDKLSTDELIVNLILLFAAGHGTTTHLLGNGLNALMRFRGQWELLLHDSSLIPSAVSELLRFDAPVQATSREATEDVEVGGKTVRAGERVTVFLGSANRDETQFANPDELDIQRTGPRILSFGHGIHTCLGAALARLEAQVVFRELTKRFPHTTLVGPEPMRLPSRTFRGLESLSVLLR